MDSVALFAQALRAPFADQQGPPNATAQQYIRRDLAALLVGNGINPGDSTEDEQFLEQIERAVVDNPLAQELLIEVRKAAQAGDVQFGPVSVNEVAAAERLALLMVMVKPSMQATSIAAFVQASNKPDVDPVAVFALAAQVHAELAQGYDFAAHKWQRLVIPGLLQLSRVDEQTGIADIALVKAATGDPVPEPWTAALEWVRPWVMAQLATLARAGQQDLLAVIANDSD
jgi:hypothetical protein